MVTHSKTRKNLRRIFTVILSLAMILSNLSVGQVYATTNDASIGNVYAFDATTLDATGVEDKSPLPAGTVYLDYFKVIGSVTQRTNSDGTMKALEIAKALQGALQFTVSGTADVVLNVSSTGGENTSAVAIIDADGNVIANKEGLTHVSTTSATTLTYEGLAAGTYQLVSPEDENYKRGFRLMNITVTEAAAASEMVYAFDATTLDATGVEDKAALKSGTMYLDYYKVIGSVTQRTNSDGTMKALEIAKALQGAFQFTVSGTADVVLNVSSTGGENTSAVAIIDADGNVVANKEGLTHVSTTSATTLTYEGLAAGTYQLVSPEDENYKRGFRLMNITVTEAAAASEMVYAFDATTLDATGVEDKAALKSGTMYLDYYKVIGSVTQRTNSDGTMKALEIAKALQGAFQFTVSGTADVVLNVSSTGGENTSAVAIIDADGNVVANKEGLTHVSTTGATTLTYEGLAAGTYQLVSPEDENYKRGFRLLNITVTDLSAGATKAPRASWKDVASPEITEVKLSESGDSIKVAYTMLVGYDGADKVDVIFKDGSGNELDRESNAADAESGEVSFKPAASGDYTFSVVAVRDGEEDKVSQDKTFEGFVLPLGAPAVSSATCLGGGSVAVAWDAVKEAEKYIVTVNGTDISAETGELSVVLEGLTIDKTYTISVVAVRGDEQSKEGTIEKKVVDELQRTWAFAAFGSSVNSEKNGYIGDINDGSVTVFSEGGKGKLVPASTDGLAFYYTEVPSNMNFTLKAKINVDSWTLSNGQDGFGIMAADRVGASGDSSTFWNNSYMAFASKVEYYWDGVKVANSGTKVSMKLGIAAQEKVGVTKDNLALFEASDTATINNEFHSSMLPFETSAVGLESGTYNLIGNATAEVAGTLENPITEMVFQIQKNNTGYFISYFDENGKEVVHKYYDTQALSQLDEETVYVGFFASRNARITVSDVEYTEIAPEDDAPAEERPLTMIEPVAKVESSKTANNENYEFAFYANADGVLTVTGPDGVIADKVEVTAEVKKIIDTKLNKGENIFQVVFVPDENYKPSEYEVLSTYKTTEIEHIVNYRVNEGNVLYVSPDGKPGADGSKDAPMDIYTAVFYASPGQKLLLKEGTYSLKSTVTVSRGIDGTADKMIYLMADPEAKSRPVFDFNKECAGMVIAGDYWYLQGFDVTNSANGQKGVQISGSNNVADDLHTYRNGNTGIQISRYKSTDLKEEWPANNLVLNCTSYLNADAGYEDADGFAAKLTVGEGNIFDGCIAAYNADDGWDLFAKVETGAIGSVTIQNSIAFKNGYDLTADYQEIDAGNGNGFKLGGEGITGNHKLINSIAFGNKAKGIDSNSCPDIKVENCTSYNNGSYNVALYSKNTSETDFAAKGILSLKNGMEKMVDEEIKPLGKQTDTSEEIFNTTNYYFDGTDSKNSAGDKADISWFEKCDVEEAVKGISRNADKTINMNGYFVLTDAAAADAGMRMTGVASADLAALVKAELGDSQESVTEPTQTPATQEPAKATQEPAKEQDSEPATSDSDVVEESTSPMIWIIVVAVIACVAGGFVVIRKVGKKKK